MLGSPPNSRGYSVKNIYERLKTAPRAIANGIASSVSNALVNTNILQAYRRRNQTADNQNVVADNVVVIVVNPATESSQTQITVDITVDIESGEDAEHARGMGYGSSR